MRNFCKFTVKSPAASYIPLPRFLLQDEQLRDISNDAKVLYALLLDRASVSRQNGYIEPDGTIRLYFTLEQAQKKLHRSRQCATRIFRELEYSGLIVRRKQGLGKPAIITLNYPADAKLITKEEADEKGSYKYEIPGEYTAATHTRTSPKCPKTHPPVLQQRQRQLSFAGRWRSLCLPASHFLYLDLQALPAWCSSSGAGTGGRDPPSQRNTPLQGLRSLLSGRFRTRQILCEMCRRGTPKAEGRTRPKKEVGRRQLTPRKPFVYKAFQKPLFKSVYVFT